MPRPLAPLVESCQRLWVFCHVIRQEFQRHKPMQPAVLCLVNNTHPAAAQLFDDAIVRENLINQRIVPHHVLHILGCTQRASQRTHPGATVTPSLSAAEASGGAPSHSSPLRVQKFSSTG